MCRPVQSAAVTHEQHPTAKSEQPSCRVTHSDPCRKLTNSGQWVHFLWEYYLSCPFFLRATTRLIQKRFYNWALKRRKEEGEKNCKSLQLTEGRADAKDSGPHESERRKRVGETAWEGERWRKFWCAWRTREGNCRPLGCAMHEGASAVVLGRLEQTPREECKDIWATRGRYEMKVDGNMHDFPGLRVNEWWESRVSRVRISLTQNSLLYITVWPPSHLLFANRGVCPWFSVCFKLLKPWRLTLPLFFFYSAS